MTKAMTRAERRRAKKARTAQSKGGSTPKQGTAPQGRSVAPVRPTPERQARGVWAKPPDTGRNAAPMIDRAYDMIGALYAKGRITHSQEQAARTFQEVRARFIADLGVSGYKSCLAGGIGGYDGGDGDPEAAKAYYAIRDKMAKRIGPAPASRFMRILEAECDKGPEDRPDRLTILRVALDYINA